jgi:hypothetical protein
VLAAFRGTTYGPRVQVGATAEWDA